MEQELFCGKNECSEPATWVRHTQFAGSHPFCTTHAREQDNFGKPDPSYFFWEEIPTSKTERKKHSRVVVGYNGSLEELAKSILDMDYSAVAEFLDYWRAEIRRQAKGDRERGYSELANMLDEATYTAAVHQGQFVRIADLCKPHNENE